MMTALESQRFFLMGTVFIIVLIVLLALFWTDSMKSRERAIAAAHRACRELNVQLLDQTVSLESLKPGRDVNGRFAFRRIYGFDFSVEGHERKRGRAFLLGQAVQQMQLDTDEGMIIEDRDGSSQE